LFIESWEIRMKIRSISSALVAGLLHLGCAGSMAPKDSQAPDSPAAASPVAASKAELPQDPREKHWASQIAFIDDDYARAKQDGTAQRRPIFIDSWATWCHTCLSMRSFVLPDAGLRGVKDSVTWLSIETEQEKNRAFVEKFPAEGLPTFLIVDPDDEQILGRWLGSGSTNEMRGFVEAGVAAYRAKRVKQVANTVQSLFFVGSRGSLLGKPLGDRQVHRIFTQLRKQLGWVDRGGHGQPRIHDLRHSFAVRRLTLWHEHAIDLNQRMLALSTYMGHVKIAHTYWYLTGVPELMALAGARFEFFACAGEFDHE